MGWDNWQVLIQRLRDSKINYSEFEAWVTAVTGNTVTIVLDDNRNPIRVDTCGHDPEFLLQILDSMGHPSNVIGRQRGIYDPLEKETLEWVRNNLSQNGMTNAALVLTTGSLEKRFPFLYTGEKPSESKVMEDLLNWYIELKKYLDHIGVNG